MKTKTIQRPPSSGQTQALNGTRRGVTGNDARMIFAHRPPTPSGMIAAWSPDSIGSEKSI